MGKAVWRWVGFTGALERNREIALGGPKYTESLVIYRVSIPYRQENHGDFDAEWPVPPKDLRLVLYRAHC